MTTLYFHKLWFQHLAIIKPFLINHIAIQVIVKDLHRIIFLVIEDEGFSVGRRVAMKRVLFLVFRQLLVVDSFITTILTQVSTSTVLIKVLHHLFEVFLCFHNSDILEFGCKGKYLMC